MPLQCTYTVSAVCVHSGVDSLIDDVGPYVSGCQALTKGLVWFDYFVHVDTCIACIMDCTLSPMCTDYALWL